MPIHMRRQAYAHVYTQPWQRGIQGVCWHLYSYCLYSYGLYSYGLHGYYPHSYGLYGLYSYTPYTTKRMSTRSDGNVVFKASAGTYDVARTKAIDDDTIMRL